MHPGPIIDTSHLPRVKDFNPEIFEILTNLDPSLPENAVLYLQWFDCKMVVKILERVDSMEMRMQAIENIICP